MGSPYKIIKDIGIIGISQVITNLSSFLLLPVITKSLGPYDYGIWTQILLTISLLAPVASMGLSMGIIRFLSGEQNIQWIREKFYSVLFIVFFSGVLISTLLFLASDVLGRVVFGDLTTSYFIKCASFLVLLTAINQIALFYFRVFQRTNTFAILNIFKSIGHLILTISLLYSGFGLLSIIFSLLTIELILFVLSMNLIVLDIGFSQPTFKGIKEILHYSLPLTPNSLIRWVTDSSDRYLITYFLGLNYAGIYSASYSIGNLIYFIISPIQIILFPHLSRLYNEGKHNEVKTYISYSLKYFLYLSIPSVFGLTLLSKPLISILTTPEFLIGSCVVPFIAVSGLLAGIFQILINITLLVKKTKFNLFIFLFAALLNIILNFLLIPLFGIIGAAGATFASYLLMVIICAHVTFKFIKPDINWIFISKCVLSSLIMCFLLFFLDSSNLYSLLRNVLIGSILYITSSVFLKSFTEEEQIIFKNVLKKLLKNRLQNYIK